MDHPPVPFQDASAAEQHSSAPVAERHSSACEAEQMSAQPQPGAWHEDTPLTTPSLQDGFPPWHALYLADTAAAAGTAAAAAVVVAAVAAVAGEHAELQASAVLYIDLRSCHYLPYCSNVTCNNHEKIRPRMWVLRATMS